MGATNLLPFSLPLELLDGCSECGMAWAVPGNFLRSRRSDKQTFYCPNGHSQHFAQSETERLRAELAAEKQRHQLAIEAEQKSRARAWELAQRERELKDAAERRASAARGVVTRIKNRVGNGVCPCCRRTFQNLLRHMSTQHPLYKDGGGGDGSDDGHEHDHAKGAGK